MTKDEILNRFCPTIIQIFEHPCDFIGRISVPWTPELEVEPVPPLYYRIIEGDPMYIIWGVYHRYDAASRHHHDFEGILMEIVPYELARIATCFHLNIKFYDIATVCHSRALYFASPPCFLVEPRGHGIILDSGRDGIESSFITYKHFQFIDMDSPEFQSNWDVYKKEFNPSVKMPDQWSDINLNVYCQKKRPVINGKELLSSEGLFWHDPKTLFDLAEKAGRI